MCTFITAYLIALVSILLGIAGFIYLIYGLISKRRKLTIAGSIMTFLAILIIVSGIFWGTKRVYHFAVKKYKKEMCMHHRCHDGGMCMGMGADSLMMMKDSAGCQMGMDKKCCEMMNCCHMKCCHMKNCCEKKCDMKGDTAKCCKNKMPQKGK